MSDHVLYRMFNADGELLYVGVTLRPVTRLRDHSRTQSWWSQVDTIQLKTYRSREELLVAERAAIKIEKPRFNVALNGLPRRRYYSIEQVAEAVCGDAKWPSIKWLHRQIKNGRLTGRKAKGVWRFTDADVDALIEACRNRALLKEAY